MKKFLLSFCFLLAFKLSGAQLTGDTIVCSGSIYSYTANIANAVTYQWTFPAGWYDITGQGSSTSSATCNVGVGDVCVEGFDALSNSLGTICLTTQYGGGSSVGWDAYPPTNTSCQSQPFSITIIPNGTGGGGCPPGCGSGINHPNIVYAIYDDVWPLGNFVGYADGSSIPGPTIPGFYNFYVYYVDVTNGTSTAQAIQILGSCGGGTVNNNFQVGLAPPTSPGFNQNPNIACVGDTIDVYEFTGTSYGNYYSPLGLTILSQSGNSMTAIVNSLLAHVEYSGVDFYGCPSNGTAYIYTVSCAGSLVGDSVVCDGVTYNYTATIPFALTYQWGFPTGWNIVSGQGTATVSATCLYNNGWVSVTGYDSIGNIVGVVQLLAQLGSVAYCSGGGLTGDTVVCAGYTYNYTANIAGAVSYQWTFPSGWYSITGQSTATASATCNLNAGNICVEGFDAGGNSLGTTCILTQFGGGGGGGWDVQPSSVSGCAGMSFTASVVPNGTGGGPGCPAGCGNGTIHPNIVYGLYDNIWPNCNLLGFADGVSMMYLGGFGGPAYVYLVDVTNGTFPPQAIKIEGGCGGGVVNNVCTINPYTPIPPNILQFPDPACVGDTIQLMETTGIGNPCWGCISTIGLNFLNPGFSNPMIAVVTAPVASTDVTGIDGNGCLTYMSFTINTISCIATPSVSFASSDTIFCDKQNIDFFDFSNNNPTSWQWTFTGASPSSSTLQNPTTIYYATNGSFDVTLVACNVGGCDTLTLPGFIVEYPAPPAPVVTGNSGTLYCTAATTYAWYSTSNPTLILSTDSFFIPTQIGSYYVITSDGNGCEATSNVFAITSMNLISNADFNVQVISGFNTEQLHLIITQKQNSELKISICDAAGKVLLTKVVGGDANHGQLGSSNHGQLGNSNQEHYSLDVSSLASGIYFVTIETSSQKITKKFLVK